MKRCTIRSGLAASAVALATVVAPGCATTTAPTSARFKEEGQPNPGNPYVMRIAFDAAGCPVSAESEVRNCPDQRPDCVHVRAGQSVRFLAEPKTDFTLVFDPFGQTALDVTGDRTLVAQKNAKSGKPYTFVVRDAARTCPPLDPQIILD